MGQPHSLPEKIERKDDPRAKYTVGVIAADSSCLTALDGLWTKPKLGESKERKETKRDSKSGPPTPAQDPNAYIYGMIDEISVVVAVLPHGDASPATVSITAAHLLHSFPRVERLLLYTTATFSTSESLNGIFIPSHIIQHDCGVVRENMMLTAPELPIGPSWVTSLERAKSTLGPGIIRGWLASGNMIVRNPETQLQLLDDYHCPGLDHLSAGILALETDAAVVAASDLMKVPDASWVKILIQHLPEPSLRRWSGLLTLPKGWLSSEVDTIIIHNEPFEAQSMVQHFDVCTQELSLEPAARDILTAFGTIGDHKVVVIARATAGRHYPEAAMAALATHASRNFPSASLALVGTAGGALGLGDVVVSSSVVQYDRGTLSEKDEFKRSGLGEWSRGRRWAICREPVGRWIDQARPPAQSAKLPRPQAHCGKIISGDLIIEDAKTRDELQSVHHCLALTTGRAGPGATDVPCVAILGIAHRCDGRAASTDVYRYAAENAAAYLAELLTNLHSGA